MQIWSLQKKCELMWAKSKIKSYSTGILLISISLDSFCKYSWDWPLSYKDISVWFQVYYLCYISNKGHFENEIYCILQLAKTQDLLLLYRKWMTSWNWGPIAFHRWLRHYVDFPWNSTQRCERRYQSSWWENRYHETDSNCHAQAISSVENI